MRKVLIALAVLVALVVATGVYLYKMVTFQPEEMKVNPEVDYSTLTYDDNNLRKTITQTLHDKGQVALNGDEVALLLLGELHQETDPDFIKGVKKFNCSIRDGQMHLEMVADISRINTEHMDENQKDLLEKIKLFMPKDLLKNMYLSIEGKPYYKDGKITWPGSTKLHFGEFGGNLFGGDNSKFVEVDFPLVKELGASGFSLQDDKLVFKR